MSEEKVKAYELRHLEADDVFPMFQIISKIGVKEFKSCFESPDVQKAISGLAAGEKKQADLEKRRAKAATRASSSAMLKGFVT